MKDKVVIGSMAGAIGGAVGVIFSYTMFRLGISPMSSINLAASLVVKDVVNLTVGGIFWALIVHFLVASLYGVILMYFLIFSGKEYWAIKGAGFGAVLCLISHSYLIPLMRTDEQVRNLIFNAPSFGTILISHVLISSVTAYILVKSKIIQGEVSAKG